MDPSVSSASFGLIHSIWLGFNGQSLVELLCIGLLLILSSIVAATEVSFFSFTPAQTEEIKQSGKTVAQKVIDLLDRPKTLIATFVLSHNLVNIGVVVLSEMLFDEVFDFSGNVALGFVIEVITVTFFILLIGEVIPKVYATTNSVSIAMKMAYPLLYTEKLLWPFVRIMVGFSNLLDKRIKKKTPGISVDDLSQALELTSNEHTPEEERKILQGIVEFGNTEARQIMKPRIDMVAFDEETDFTTILELIVKNGFSRVPVYRNTPDEVIGILFIKDMIAWLHEGPAFAWQQHLRPAFFIPENKKINELMRDFQVKKQHLAIVVDEFGGTSGIVTLEDVIEEIIGEINDEFDDDELVYSRLDEKTVVFEAKIPLNDLYRVLDIDGEAFENKKGDADSLAGFILELSEKIPAKNEEIIFSNFKFIIESVDKRRIKRVKVVKLASSDSHFNDTGKILMKSLILPVLLSFCLGFTGCESEFSPKPKGYFRIDFPEKEYRSLETACPYTFEYPVYAQMVPYQGQQQEECWMNIDFPTYRARIYLSYFPLTQKEDLPKHLEDSRTLVYKHTVKADAIDEVPLRYDDRKVYGLLYLIHGNSASSRQFYLTDSISGFIRGALYFDAAPNSDSLEPVLTFIDKDLQRMIQSFSWQKPLK